MSSEKDVVDKVDDAVKRMKEAMVKGVQEVIDTSQNAALIVEHTKEINELEKRGIHINNKKSTKYTLFFNCDTHPYLPEPNDEVRRILGKIGNTWHYEGPTKTLKVTKADFSYNK